MKWSTHALIGAAAGSFTGSVTGSEIWVLVAIGGAFGILPDIDIMLSGLSRTAHRSPATHSLLGASLLTSAWLVLCLAVGAGQVLEFVAEVPLVASSATAFTSAFSHAAADTLSVGGCRALYPLSRRKFRGPVRYDDWAANTALMVVASGVILVSASLDLSSIL